MDQLHIAGALTEHFRSRGIQEHCPMCGSEDLQIGDLIQGISVDLRGSLRSTDSRTIPMIQVICNQCSYVLLFSPWNSEAQKPQEPLPPA